MASFIYDTCLHGAFRGRFDFDNGTFRVLLLSAEYHPDKVEHARRSDLVGEVSGLGYGEGGSLADVKLSMTDSKLSLSLGGFKMPKATVSARYAVYVRDTGDAFEDDLIACIDFGSDVTSTNGPWELENSSLKIQN